MNTHCTWVPQQAGTCPVAHPLSSHSAAKPLVQKRCHTWSHVAGVRASKADSARWQAILHCSSSSWQTRSWEHGSIREAGRPLFQAQRRKRHNGRYTGLLCWSSAEDRPELQPTGGSTQQQQAGLQADFTNNEYILGRQYTAVVMPNLEQQPPPRVHPLLAWLPPPLQHHTHALLGFLRACWRLLPEFASPSLPEAFRRLALVLGASLVMIVVISTIDSAWLYLYLLNARRIPVAA